MNSNSNNTVIDGIINGTTMPKDVCGEFERMLSTWGIVPNKEASADNVRADTAMVQRLFMASRPGYVVQLRGALQILGIVKRYPGYKDGDKVMTSPLVEVKLHHIEEDVTISPAANGHAVMRGHQNRRFVARTESGSEVVVCSDDYGNGDSIQA